MQRKKDRYPPHESCVVTQRKSRGWAHRCRSAFVGGPCCGSKRITITFYYADIRMCTNYTSHRTAVADRRNSCGTISVHPARLWKKSFQIIYYLIVLLYKSFEKGKHLNKPVYSIQFFVIRK